MKLQYNVEGITCGGCISTVTDKLKNLKNIEQLKVQREFPQISFEYERPVDIMELQKILGNFGKYQVLNSNAPLIFESESELNSKIETYKPVLIIVLFVSIFSVISANGDFIDLINNLLSGFFVVFSFFKLVDFEGFTTSFTNYDIIARKFKFYAIIYPFIEFFLGVLYFLNIYPSFTNFGTVIIIGIGLIGIVQSVVYNRGLPCACLGNVFNLPVNKFTILVYSCILMMSSFLLIQSLI